MTDRPSTTWSCQVAWLSQQPLWQWCRLDTLSGSCCRGTDTVRLAARAAHCRPGDCKRDTPTHSCIHVSHLAPVVACRHPVTNNDLSLCVGLLHWRDRVPTAAQALDFLGCLPGKLTVVPWDCIRLCQQAVAVIPFWERATPN